MPNPMNTFLWRYLADQNAKKVQERAEGQWLAEKSIAMQDKRDAADLEHGTALGQLGEEVGPDAAPALLRGHKVGRASAASEKAKQQAALRQALGLKEVDRQYSTDLELQKISNTNDQNRLDRQHALQLARIAAASRGMSHEDTRRERLARDLEEREVGGFSIEEGRVPTLKSAETMNTTASAANAALTSLDDMERIYKGNKAELFFGEKHRQSEGARKNIYAQMAQLQNLGVLQKTDIEFLTGLIPDPNSVSGVFDEVGTQAAFEQLRTEMQRRIQHNAKARGYVVNPGTALTPAAPAGPSASAVGGKVRVKMPDGNEFNVAAEKVQGVLARYPGAQVLQ